jgi:hypothetical protein
MNNSSSKPETGAETVNNPQAAGGRFIHGPDPAKWPATPRYLMAELERFGHAADDARRIAWAAWVNSTSTDERARRVSP